MRARAALFLVLGVLPAIRATAAAPLTYAPGAPLKKTALTRAWTVSAPGAMPGDIVRLAIPDPVYVAYQGNFSDLHVEAQGQEIQYTPDFQPEGRPVLQLPEASPCPTGEAGVSRIDLPPLDPGRSTAVRLSARPLPFYRKVQVVDGSTVLSEGSWTCLPASPHPCALELSLGSSISRSSHLSLRFLDGNNPPLPAVVIAIWRKRDSLAFAWPRSGPVHLLTGVESTDSWNRGDEALYRATHSRPSRRAWVAVPRQTEISAAPAFVATVVLLLALLGWKSRRRLRPALTLAALAALPGSARADAGRLYSRPVAVPSAGVVRVPLDLATLRHLGADGAGLRVFGPKGEEVPGWMQPYPADDPKTLHLLTYPPSRERFLRITTPAAEAAGLQGATLGVVGARPRVLSAPADHLECESARQRTWCRLGLPARWQRPVRLALDLTGPEETAIRVYTVREGRLSLLVQAVRRSAGGGSRFVLPLISGALVGETLRIELQGVAQAPRVTGATLDLAQPVAVFRAASPGRYELRYGDGHSYEDNNNTNDRPASDAEESSWIAPGPESARELPPLPRSTSSPVLPLDRRFAAAWQVHTTGAKPGDIVRLEVPAEVYEHSRSFGEDLRLSAGGRQIPYICQAADDPALVLSRQGLRPQHSPPDEGQIDVHLPQPGLPLTTWQVTFGPQARDGESVRLWFPYTKKEVSAYETAYGNANPRLPLRIEGDFGVLRQRAGPRAREIRLTAGSPVDLALWRSRDVLVFVWPREGPVILRTGSDEGAPRYDLQLFASDLLARPWRAAALGPKEPEVRLLRLLALLAGAGIALVLLRKALPAA